MKQRVLWITNSLFPEAIAILTNRPNQSKGSGGWLLGSAEEICKSGRIDLIVASVAPFVKKLTRIKGKEIVYYAIPCRKERKYHREFEAMWKIIVANEKPDIVHIHGSEFAHGLAFLRANTGIKTFLSIQGLPSAIGDYFSRGLTFRQIFGNITPFDLLYAGSIYHQAARFKKYGATIESEYYHRANVIIGRTSFDKARVFAINPRAYYVTCQETLRPEFYDGSVWEYTKCIPHSIFISQANYPIKGLHQVIKAVNLIKNKYPDIQVRVAGHNILYNKGIRSYLTRSTYSQIIKRMVKRFRLEANFRFLGPLTAEEMKMEYLSANVFVCPSSIENSPNSLGEAQILGVPCVASYSGGIPDFIPNESCGWLYRFDEYQMLGKLLDELFSIVNSFDGTYERELALQRHSREVNLSRLLDIYKES